MVTDDLLFLSDEIDNALSEFDPSPIAPLPVDRWMASSILQKTIRRGLPDIAQRAALTLLTAAPRNLWQRLQLIGFEDIGVGDPATASVIVGLVTNDGLKRIYGSEKIASYAAHRLAAAPKCRAADHLLCASLYHKGHRQDADELFETDNTSLIRVMMDDATSTLRRAIAAIYLTGIFVRGQTILRYRKGSDVVWDALRDVGTPESLLMAAKRSCRATRSPLPALVCFAHSIRNNGGEVSQPILTTECGLEDIPLCALDMFTRPGKHAISRLKHTSPALRDIPIKALHVALFHAEGGRLCPSYRWEQSATLERQCIEAELSWNGIPWRHTDQVLETVRQSLPLLNNIRRDMLPSLLQENAS